MRKKKKCKEKLSTKNKLKKSRKTRQVRIKEEWYELVRLQAREDKATMSKFLDQVFLSHFGKTGWRKAKKLSRKTVRYER